MNQIDPKHETREVGGVGVDFAILDGGEEQKHSHGLNLNKRRGVLVKQRYKFPFLEAKISRQEVDKDRGENIKGQGDERA